MHKVTKNGQKRPLKFFTYAKWLYTITAIADQKRTLGINRLLGTEKPKLIKQAKGVKTMAEA